MPSATARTATACAAWHKLVTSMKVAGRFKAIRFGAYSLAVCAAVHVLASDEDTLRTLACSYLACA